MKRLASLIFAGIVVAVVAQGVLGGLFVLYESGRAAQRMERHADPR
jgi:hypothetical protein